jgi:WD40 repeat protein
MPGEKPSGAPDTRHPLRGLKIWNANTGALRRSLSNGLLIHALAFYPDGKRLAGSEAGIVKVWDAATGQELLVIRGHHDVVRALSVSSDGERLLTGSSDGTVKVWDATTGAHIGTITRPPGMYNVAFSRDGKQVAITGRSDDAKAEICIWDVIRRRELVRMTHDSVIHGAIFSPDGRRVASFGGEATKITKPGLVEVWELPSGRLLFARQGHSREVTCLDYSPDGRRLASGSEDGTVVIWDATTGIQLANFAAHVREGDRYPNIQGLAFSPDGNELATASWDGSVKIWDVKDANSNKETNKRTP